MKGVIPILTNDKIKSFIYFRKIYDLHSKQNVPFTRQKVHIKSSAYIRNFYTVTITFCANNTHRHTQKKHFPSFEDIKGAFIFEKSFCKYQKTSESFKDSENIADILGKDAITGKSRKDFYFDVTAFIHFLTL